MMVSPQQIARSYESKPRNLHYRKRRDPMIMTAILVTVLVLAAEAVLILPLWK